MDDRLCHSLNHRAVLQLFRAAHGIAISAAGISDIESASAEDLVRISSAHGVAPLMADGLDHLDENRLSIDRDLRIFWQEIREGNRLRNQKMKAQLTEAARILADENIPVVVLKGGCELVQPSTQKFHRRFIGDLDLLVAKADLSKAMSALQASGYEDAYEDDEFFHSPDHHDTPLFNRRYPAAIEMHKAIGGKGGEQFLPADEILGTAEGTPIANLRIPSRLIRLVHAVFHGQVQHSGYQDRLISLRNIADLVTLVDDHLHATEACDAFEAAGMQRHFDGMLAATDLILPSMLPSLEPDEAAKIWACTAIGRIGTPRKASFDKQARKVSGWITSFATDKHLRSIYRSKLMKPGRVRRMLQTLRKFRQY